MKRAELALQLLKEFRAYTASADLDISNRTKPVLIDFFASDVKSQFFMSKEDFLDKMVKLREEGLAAQGIGHKKSIEALSPELREMMPDKFRSWYNGEISAKEFFWYALNELDPNGWVRENFFEAV